VILRHNVSRVAVGVGASRRNFVVAGIDVAAVKVPWDASLVIRSGCSPCLQQTHLKLDR